VTALKPFQILNALMLLMFVFSVVVQYNDPDPAVWMTIYGSAALACIAVMLKRDIWIFPAAVFVLATVWAATISPHVLGKVPFLEMFSAWEMKDVGVEESREMYGLLIVAIWMAVLMLRARRRRKTAGSS
jgi:hypothetical protein